MNIKLSYTVSYNFYVKAIHFSFSTSIRFISLWTCLTTRLSRDHVKNINLVIVDMILMADKFDIF